MYHIEQIDRIHFPLVKKFYQAFYPSGKPNKADPIWVLKHGQKILSAVRFKQLEQVQLLTAMVTEPNHRGQGLAQQLLAQLADVIATVDCYCFALPYLEGFYQQHGFHSIHPETLPLALYQRFQAYSKNGRALLPMQHRPTNLTPD